MTTRVAGRSVRHDAARRRIAAAALAAAFAGGVLGTLLAVQPAHAATAEADIEAKVTGGGSIQGKVGDKASVGFKVTNHGKVDASVVIRISARGQAAQIESAGGCRLDASRTSASCAMKGGASVDGSVQVVLRAAGEGDGTIAAGLAPGQRINDPKPGNNTDAFKMKVTGASASPTPSKTRSSRSASAEPTGNASDVVIAPPEAGNGAIPQEEPKTAPVKDEGGLSFGFWVGVVAIVAALGLVGSLFYFRRKDRLEPDTGVFHLPTAGNDQATSVLTPGAYPPPYQGGSNVYGVPAASPPPPPLPPLSSGNNDQTVLMRRPDDL